MIFAIHVPNCKRYHGGIHTLRIWCLLYYTIFTIIWQSDQQDVWCQMLD